MTTPKNTKVLATLAVLGALSVGLVGCSTTDAATTDSTSTTDTTSTTEATPEAMDPSATAGDAAAPPMDGAQTPPDFTEAADMLGVTADELTAALGEPPFDLAAAAETLGVTEAELEAALPDLPAGQ